MMRKLTLSTVVCLLFLTSVGCSGDSNAEGNGDGDPSGDPSGDGDGDGDGGATNGDGDGDGDGDSGDGGSASATGGSDPGEGTGGSDDGTGGSAGPTVNWDFETGADQWKYEDNSTSPFVVTDGRMCLSSDPGPIAVSWPDGDNMALLVPVTPGTTYRFSAAIEISGATYANTNWVGLCENGLDHFAEWPTDLEATTFVHEFEAQCDAFGIYIRNDSNGPLCFDNLTLEEVQ